MTNEFIINPKQKNEGSKHKYDGGYNSAEHDRPLLESVANFGIELAIEGNSQIFYNFGGFGLFAMNILVETARAFVFMDEVHFVELFNTEIVGHD